MNARKLMTLWFVAGVILLTLLVGSAEARIQRLKFGDSKKFALRQGRTVVYVWQTNGKAAYYDCFVKDTWNVCGKLAPIVRTRISYKTSQRGEWKLFRNDEANLSSVPNFPSRKNILSLLPNGEKVVAYRLQITNHMGPLTRDRSRKIEVRLSLTDPGKVHPGFRFDTGNDYYELPAGARRSKAQSDRLKAMMREAEEYPRRVAGLCRWFGRYATDPRLKGIGGTVANVAIKRLVWARELTQGIGQFAQHLVANGNNEGKQLLTVAARAEQYFAQLPIDSYTKAASAFRIPPAKIFATARDYLKALERPLAAVFEASPMQKIIVGADNLYVRRLTLEKSVRPVLDSSKEFPRIVRYVAPELAKAATRLNEAMEALFGKNYEEVRYAYPSAYREFELTFRGMRNDLDPIILAYADPFAKRAAEVTDILEGISRVSRSLARPGGNSEARMSQFELGFPPGRWPIWPQVKGVRPLSRALLRNMADTREQRQLEYDLKRLRSRKVELETRRGCLEISIAVLRAALQRSKDSKVVTQNRLKLNKAQKQLNEVNEQLAALPAERERMRKELLRLEVQPVAMAPAAEGIAQQLEQLVTEELILKDEQECLIDELSELSKPRERAKTLLKGEKIERGVLQRLTRSHKRSQRIQHARGRKPNKIDNDILADFEAEIQAAKQRLAEPLSTEEQRVQTQLETTNQQLAKLQAKQAQLRKQLEQLKVTDAERKPAESVGRVSAAY